MASPTLGPSCVEQRRIVGEDLDLDRLRRVGRSPIIVLQHLRELDVQLRLGGLDLLAHIVHHLVDRAAALGFQLHGEVAGVGFGDGGEAHLQAGAARGDFDFGRGVQDALDMLKNAIGLAQRTAGRHDVVEDEAALIHLRQQVGAERLVAGPGADDKQQAGAADPERLGQRPVQRAFVEFEARGSARARG